jgi:aryl-alcohol dehydrogenase-like predicted oxidoreductase
MTNITEYRPLGRSGLVVSPLALGTMTFGTTRWGADAKASRAIYDAYTDSGGNFIDTADVYSSGASEEMLGGFIRDAGARDRVVLATKSGFPSGQGHPHVGGNGAKHLHRALHGSLKRLATEYIDLYWIHVWDQVTPFEEVLGTLCDLVRSGKIRYFGLSNIPSWYAASMATLARARGLPQPIALQFEYSLVERGIEYEHIAVAGEFGMGIVPWSPLAGGFLTGKYDRKQLAATAPTSDPEHASGSRVEVEASSGRGRLVGANPFGDSKFTDRNWKILDLLRIVANEVSATPAAVALAWVAGRPGVAATLIGASRAQQISDNVAALSVRLSSEQRERLDKASEPQALSPFDLFSPKIRKMIFGGNQVAQRS